MVRGMIKRLQDGFAFGVAVLLFVVALPLLLAAGTRTEVLTLDTADPLLFLTHRQVLYVFGGVQLALSAFLLLSGRRQIQLCLIAWLASNLFIYQAGCFWYGAGTLGGICHLTNRLPVSPWVFDWFTLAVFGAMVVGSSFILVFDWWVGRRPSTRSTAAGLGGRDVVTAT